MIHGICYDVWNPVVGYSLLVSSNVLGEGNVEPMEGIGGTRCSTVVVPVNGNFEIDDKGASLSDELFLVQRTMVDC